jgi:hypothetical protein
MGWVGWKITWAEERREESEGRGAERGEWGQEAREVT